MRQPVRTARHDPALGLEAYCLQGVERPFPCHVHDHYVIGVVDRGTRSLTCRGRREAIGPGDVLLFNPGDSHGCVQEDGVLDYRGLNIPRDAMRALAERSADLRVPPGFTQPVVRDRELARRLAALHRAVLEGAPLLRREEALVLAFGRLLPDWAGRPPAAHTCRAEVERACAFMGDCFARPLTLADISRQAGLGKSALVRAFARETGVTPYRYLLAVRVDRARQMLEQGRSPAETALAAGFSDQSHFTNCFTAITGLTPGAYRALFREERERG